MTKTFLAPLGALLALAAASCARAPAPRDDAAISAGVTALVEDWSSAGEEGRWDDLKNLYADEKGFVWIEQGRIAYADRASVVEGVEQAAAMGAKIDSKVSEISVTPLSPDAAAFHARSVLSVASPSFSFAFDGRLSGVAVKRGEKWRFLQGHLSALQSPQDAATGAPEAAPKAD